MVHEHLQRGGCADVESKEHKRNWGLALHGGIPCFGLSFSAGWEGKPGDRDALERNGELVMGTSSA